MILRANNHYSSDERSSGLIQSRLRWNSALIDLIGRVRPWPTIHQTLIMAEPWQVLKCLMAKKLDWARKWFSSRNIVIDITQLVDKQKTPFIQFSRKKLAITSTQIFAIDIIAMPFGAGLFELDLRVSILLTFCGINKTCWSILSWQAPKSLGDVGFSLFA